MLSILRRLPFSMLVALLLVSCATTPDSGFRYNEVVIVNRTLSAITDVTVAATDTGRLFSCGNIAPRGICSNQFPPRDYRNSPIEVSWSIANGRKRRQLVEVQVPTRFIAEVPMRGVLIIDSRDDVEAFLEQVAPGPHL